MATREEIYTALRNADAAGDSESVKKLGEFLKSMPSEEAPAAKAEPTTPKKPKRYFPTTEAETFGEAGAAAGGVPETALQMATGAGAAAVGGLAGLGRAGYGVAKGEDVPQALAAGGGVARGIQEAGTYQPRTTGGEAVSKAAGLPIEVASELVGGGLEAAGGLVGPKTAAAGRTAGEVGPQLAAVLLGARGATRPVRGAPPVPGKDVSPLRQFSPEEAERFYRQKQQGVEPTLGGVTRDPTQVRFEQQTAQAPGGQRLYQRIREQDAALENSINVLKEGKDIKGAKGLTEVETGRTVRSALEKKAEAEWQKVDDSYEAARAAGETKKKVDVSPLVKYLADNEPAAIAVRELKSVGAGLNKLIGELPEAAPARPLGAGKVSGRVEVKPVKPKPEVTIDDLEFLRQEVGRLGQKDGSVKSYMGDVRQIIDKITEGQGGEKYQQARSARKKWGDEFEEKVGVANILEKKSRTDYKTAVEDVWRKSVIGGSIDDLGNVVNSLRTSAGKQKEASHQALKEMQARTLDYIAERAMEQGTFSPANLKKALREIGSEKLDLLLGREAIDALGRTLKTAEEVKKPPLRAPGSDTSLNQRVDMAKKLATRHAEHIVKGVLPRFAGRILDSVRESRARRQEEVGQRAAIEESLTPHRAPLADIEREAADVQAGRRKYLMGEAGKRAAPFVPATMRPEER